MPPLGSRVRPGRPGLLPSGPAPIAVEQRRALQAAVGSATLLREAPTSGAAAPASAVPAAGMEGPCRLDAEKAMVAEGGVLKAKPLVGVVSSFHWY